MAKQVENRVVEMEFKNKDFEKAVSVTMKSLEELNKKLDDLNNVNISGFENVTDKLNNTNFDRLTENIDYLKGRFSFLGEAVHDVWLDIVNGAEKAMVKIEQVITKPLDIIEEKGKRRATNLAQAKFQLTNLGVKWEDIKEDIDFAVDDTRFGLDEAAMAASQLSASGVEIGDEMKEALLGISGVAAMTNSEYSDIAHIFTTIAGTGKVYTQQLNMIAARGLNATAALARQLDTTEAGVREILSKKDQFIDFATFAKAMFNEYGESAKKGNDLFTGALANAKAALGRIGEKFYTPFYEYARQVLVAVKPVINDINKAMDPLFENLSDAMANIKDFAVYIAETIHAVFEDEEGFEINFLGNIVNIKQKAGEFFAWLSDLIGGITNMLSGENGALSVIGETLYNVFSFLFNILKSVGQGFQFVFGTIDADSIMYLINGIKDLSEYLVLSEDHLESLRSTFKGVASALDIVYKTGMAIFRVFVLPVLNVLGLVGDGVLDLTGDVGDLLFQLDQMYDPFTPLYNAVHRITGVFAPLIAVVRDFAKSLGEEFSKLTGINNVERFFTSLKEVVTDLHIDDLFMFIGGAILYCVQQVSDFITALNNNAFKQYMKDLREQNTVLAWIADKYDKLKTNLNDLFTGKKKLSDLFDVEKIKEKFAWLNPIIDTFKEHYKTIFEAPAGNTEGLPLIDKFFIQFKESIKNLKWDDIFGMIGASFYAYWTKKSADFLGSISGTFKNFSDSFAQLTEGINLSLVKMTKETDAEKILKIAAGVALLAGSVVLLGKLNPQEIMTGLGTLLAVSIMIVLVVKALSKAMETTEKFEKEYDLEKTGIKDKLSSKKTGKGKKQSIIEKAFERVGSSFEYGKEKVEKTMKDLSTVPGVILALGASVWLIISSMVKLSKMIDKNPLAVTASFIMIGLILYAVTKFTQKILEFVTYNKDYLDEDKINALSKMFILMALAIRIIAGAIGTLGLVTSLAGPEAVGTATLMIGLILAEMGTIAYLLTKYAATNDKADPKTMLAVGGMFMLMAAAIQMLTIPIAAIAVIGALGGQIWQATGIVALLLAEMAVIAGLIGYFVGETAGGAVSMLAAGAAMLMMGMAISSLTIPLVAIAAIAHFSQNGELDAAVATIIGLMAVMGLIVALFGVVSGGTGGLGAAGMIAGAAAMWIIAEALQALLVPLAAMAALHAAGQLVPALTGVAVALGILALAALVAIPLAPGIATLSGALLAFGNTVMMIGVGIGAAGIGILAFIKALETLQNIDFTNMATKIGQAGAAIIHGFTGALVGGIPDITRGFKALLGGGMGALVQSLPMIVELCVVLLKDVIVGIDNHAQELGFHLGHALGDIVMYSLMGLSGSLIDILERAFGGKGEFSSFLMENMLPKKETEGTLVDKIKGVFSGNGAKEAAEESTQEIGEAGSQSLLEGFDLPTAGVQSKLDEAFGSVDLSGLSVKGTEGGESLLGGFEDSLKIEGGQSLASADLSTMVDKGFLEGSSFNLDDYKKAGSNKMNAFFEGAQEAADSHSPSRRAMELSGFIDQGFAIGLDKSHLGEDAAESKMNGMFSIFSSISDLASKSMNGSVLDTLRETISGIADAASGTGDFSPTITPVLDMSNVQSGFASLDSMFNRERSVALAGEVGSLNSANRMLNFQIQNDKSDMTGGFGSLGTKLDRLGEAIMNRQIVLDSGELVGGLVNPMDHSLGVKAIRAQRSGRR